MSLLMLVAGTFTVAQISASSRVNATRDDLTRLAAAETAYFADHDAYTFYDSVTNTSLATTYGYQPSERVAVAACASGWVAAVQASSGAVMTRSSVNNTIGTSTGAGVTLPSCANSLAWYSVVDAVTGVWSGAPACNLTAPTLVDAGKPVAVGALSGTQSSTVISATGLTAPQTNLPALSSGVATDDMLAVKVFAGGQEYCVSDSTNPSFKVTAGSSTGTYNVSVTLDMSFLTPTQYTAFTTSGTIQFNATTAPTYAAFTGTTGNALHVGS
ncbi:hypothetical protein [Curtobacterium sp. MCBD17_040]|uniref:hypothetical protein n=1 Tax=Curtobacterium sp. MCBD17_040 TaxID=2175674 RepID=UPI0011B7D3C1|nr:hypothetical protein [Curtobacterium sp. MCBD17_040]WIB65463.1 hypothetical protein DEI94_19005 [Curtobacterium sp. MCBD17_040]